MTKTRDVLTAIDETVDDYEYWNGTSEDAMQWRAGETRVTDFADHTDLEHLLNSFDVVTCTGAVLHTRTVFARVNATVTLEPDRYRDAWSATVTPCSGFDAAALDRIASEAHDSHVTLQLNSLRRKMGSAAEVAAHGNEELRLRGLGEIGSAYSRPLLAGDLPEAIRAIAWSRGIPDLPVPRTFGGQIDLEEYARLLRIP